MKAFGKIQFLLYVLSYFWAVELTSGVSDQQVDSINSIKSCYEASSPQITKTPKRRGSDKKLYLNFGKKGLEGIKVMSMDDISNIKTLANCVRSVESNFFLPSSSDDLDFNRFYGSNNVTLLNGLLPHVLPEVYAKLHSLLLDSLKKSNWNERRKHFGIRSVYVLSANRDGLDEHLEKVRERRDAKEGRKSMFIVSPIDPEAENKVQKVREIEYQRLHSYIEERPGTLYSLVVQLTDETSAHGGHLAIKVAGNEVDDDVDGENIDESEIIDEEVAKSLHRPIEDIKLEKGNSFLIPGSALFGFEPVHYGEKSCIVVEFWQYKDSFFDPRRPSLRDGEMLGLVEDRKQKAEL